MRKARSRLKKSNDRYIPVVILILTILACFWAKSQAPEQELISPYVVRASEEITVISPQVEDIKIQLSEQFYDVYHLLNEDQKNIASIIDEVWGEDYLFGRSLAFCESTLGKNQTNSQSSAEGVFHIIDSTWIETRREMNLDTSLELKLNEKENIKTAFYLYQSKGDRPWNASRSCWEKRS